MRFLLFLFRVVIEPRMYILLYTFYISSSVFTEEEGGHTGELLLFQSASLLY
jgi:hypothetical protein